MKRLPLFTFLLLPLLCASESGPIVSTAYGSVKGFEFDLMDGERKVNVFLGVPFAKPPIGELRFEKPERLSNWEEHGTLVAKKFGPACIPHVHAAIEGVAREDCLYLNIVTPAEKSCEKSGYPVLVWIHGGGYNLGSAAEFGYVNASNNFVSRGIVFVSIQYRLGPYGFLSSGDSALTSNLGYWDQAAALEFVHENIANFGGDPSRVTLLGLSAGGASISALTLSPHTRDLFSQAIEMSGSTFVEWANSGKVVEATRQLAAHLNCPVDNSHSMKLCLKKKSPEEIFAAVLAAGESRYALNILKYGPVVDGDFFPAELEKLLAEAPRKPTIIGVTEKESIYFTLLGKAKEIHQFAINPEEFSRYEYSDFVKFVERVVAPETIFGKETTDIRQRIISFYVNQSMDLSPHYCLAKYSELLSDTMFNMPALREAHMKMNLDWPVWLYVTEHFNAALFPDNFPDKGASHAFELPYLFGVFPVAEFLFDEDETRLQQTIVEEFSNFVKHSAPSKLWPPISQSYPLRNLRFRPTSVMHDSSTLSRNLEFWNSLDVFDFDIILGTARKHPLFKEEL